MTRDDIIRMAQEAGFDEWWDNGCSSWDTLQETFERFAALVAAAEREACAKVVEADGLARGDEGLVLIKAAGRIRARGEK